MIILLTIEYITHLDMLIIIADTNLLAFRKNNSKANIVILESQID